MDKLTDKEKKVREELTKIYPQLVINCRNVTGAAYNKHGGDLLAVCVEFYLSKPLDYQLKVIDDGKLEHFLTHMMNFQLKLGTTRFYHYYRKHHERQREWLPNWDYDIDPEFAKPFEDEEDPVITCLNKQIKDLDPYKKMIVEEFIKNGESYHSICKKYNISYSVLKRDTQQLILNLKRQCKHLR